MFRHGQVDLIGFSNESLIVSLINTQQDNHPLYNTEILKVNHVELDLLCNPNLYRHRPNTPSEELIISTASMNNLCGQQFDSDFLDNVKIVAAEDRMYT